jgi:hypothetical protein
MTVHDNVHHPFSIFIATKYRGKGENVVGGVR